MNKLAKNLLDARETLLAEFTAHGANAREQLSHLDALLDQLGTDVNQLPTLGDAAEGVMPKRRGRPAGTKTAKVAKAAKSPRKAGKKKQSRRNDGFNATAAVREIVAGMDKPFTVAQLREEFEKRHPGKLAGMNRIAMSLAMQSLVRKKEASAKKDPSSKGNLFFKTGKLKV